MKIMQIIPTLELAGAEVMCENLTCELSSGNDVIVVSMYDRKTPISERLQKKGIKVVFLDKKPGPDFSMVKKLRKVIREFKPDVIHTHLDCVKYAYPAGSKEGVKRFIHTVHNIASKEAFIYLYEYKGIEFIKEHYDIEHTLSIDDAVDDLTMICRNNGGGY